MSEIEIGQMSKPDGETESKALGESLCSTDSTTLSSLSDSLTDVRPTFMGIPQELRMLIFDILCGELTLWVDFKDEDYFTTDEETAASLSILQVSKQVREEARQTLHVKTLRLSRLFLMDHKRLSTLSSRIARWAGTIENVFALYDTSSFDWLVGTRRDIQHEPKAMDGLKCVTKCLPRLRNLTITCDQYFMGGPLEEMENMLKTLAGQLCGPLYDFQHITATINELNPCGPHDSQSRAAEITFKTMPEYGSKVEKAIGKRPKVLLESISYYKKRRHFGTYEYHSIQSWMREEEFIKDARDRYSVELRQLRRGHFACSRMACRRF